MTVFAIVWIASTRVRECVYKVRREMLSIETKRQEESIMEGLHPRVVGQVDEDGDTAKSIVDDGIAEVMYRRSQLRRRCHRPPVDVSGTVRAGIISTHIRLRVGQMDSVRAHAGVENSRRQDRSRKGS